MSGAIKEADTQVTSPSIRPDLQDKPWVLDERVAQHFSDTYPDTLDSYVGREHFWMMADETPNPENPYGGSVNRKLASILFTELVFPLRGNVNRPSKSNQCQVILPEEVGLSVKLREEVGMPQIPHAVRTTTSRPDRALRHVKWVEVSTALNSRVVQLRGLFGMVLQHSGLAVPEEQEIGDLSSLLTRRGLSALSAISHWPGFRQLAQPDLLPQA